MCIERRAPADKQSLDINKKKPNYLIILCNITV